MSAIHDQQGENQSKGLNLILQRMENEGFISKRDVKTFFSDIRLPSMKEKTLREKMKDSGASERGTTISSTLARISQIIPIF